MPEIKTHTYCPRLWKEAFINEKGEVFACCRSKPAVLGSIYTHKLSEIFNNETIRALRRKSLEGRLECYASCPLIEKKPIDSAERPLTIDYSRDMKRIKILFGEACNIACIMCPQDHKSKVMLDHRKLIENVDIEPFESIELQGGETLILPSAKAFFDYVASRGKKSSFLTNGLPISGTWAEKIALHSRFIYFSINAATKKTHELVNAGSRWEIVLENVAKIRRARERLGTNVAIIGHMTIVRENLHEIPAFIRSYRRLGFDTADFFHDNRVPPHLKARPVRAWFLRSAIRRALRAAEAPSTIGRHGLQAAGLL